MELQGVIDNDEFRFEENFLTFFGFIFIKIYLFVNLILFIYIYKLFDISNIWTFSEKKDRFTNFYADKTLYLLAVSQLGSFFL